MHFRRLTDEKDKMFLNAFALYESSFPSFEQRCKEEQVAVLANCEYHFDIINEEDEFIGLMLYWETTAFIYVEHFCINSTIRGKGYGQRALSLLNDKKKTIILEIDPPVDDVSCRRKSFYIKAGYVINSFAHIHPPYNTSCSGHELVVLSSPSNLTAEEYRQFYYYLKNTVMQRA